MKKEQMFDVPATDEYIKRTATHFNDKNWDTSKRFTEEQSKDFYLGMIAAERVILSFMSKYSGEDLKMATLALGIDAAIIANRK